MLASFRISDPGLVRANNEDYYLILREKGLYVVADGIGGAQAWRARLAFSGPKPLPNSSGRSITTTRRR